MEEELNEDELETKTKNRSDDGKAADNTTDSKNSTPKTGTRKNSCSNNIMPSNNASLQKITSKTDAAILNKKVDSTPKSEKKLVPPPATVTTNISTFQTTISKNGHKIIQRQEIIEEYVVDLETSDEDEVVEVVLPPKPTITIDSSDEDDLLVVQTEHSFSKTDNPQPTKSTPNNDITKKSTEIEREISASPVPSVVSSISDEFIRSDCIALNISSRTPDRPCFDFSLHGSDLIDQETPKKKKKKKNKDRESSTPMQQNLVTPEKGNAVDTLFATPKNKSKNKKKSNTSPCNIKLVEDVNKGDQSYIASKKQKSQYAVLDIPNADVYESDSNQSANLEVQKEIEEHPIIVNQEITDNNKDHTANKELDKGEVEENVIDLTNTVKSWKNIEDPIEDVMINVTGFQEDEVVENPSPMNTETNKSVHLGSTKVPAILNDNLDFDNLKGKKLFCNRRYSLVTLRAEMDKFYNESWGGEEFNHREIQKYMSRDKNLWAIDPKDKMTNNAGRKKLMCYYCNRVGHRDDTCRLKPPVCHMCGVSGHQEPRCPTKICVNCGSPNYMYSTVCRNCSGWTRITCPECGQHGHPYSHCPDIWRRYHDTIDNASPLEEIRENKKHYQLFCSGCTRRGHLVHSCRIPLRFTSLPINSPYVACYRPLYPITLAQNDNYNRQTNSKIGQKRQSKSPVVHPNHVNKRKNSGPCEEVNNKKQSESNSDNQTQTESTTNRKKSTENPTESIEDGGSNHDKRGQMIQDNEVSDTSDVVTVAKIYVMKDIIDRLKGDGAEWLKAAMMAHNVQVTTSDEHLYLSIVGKVQDQETFQTQLKNWIHPPSEANNATANRQESTETTNQDNSMNIPKNRNTAIRTLNKAFASLKEDIGDPGKLFKELNFLQNHHKQLLKQKVISPKQVSNNRDNINQMLKKLNMVLLGQAGLADGRAHLRKLHAIQTRLMTYRQKNLSKQLRQEIGQHYHCIFAAFPRDDYGDLVRIFRKRTKLSFKRKPRNENAHEKGHLEEKEEVRATEGEPERRRPLVEKTINKLVLYRRRLMRARPVDAVLKKTRRELMNKLHCHIAALGTLAQLSTKTVKKLRKVQEQAQLFLTNV